MECRKTDTQAWIVVALCFLALALAFSARAALGLVMPVWSKELEWSRSFVAGSGAAALIAMAAIAPFAGRLVDRYGPSGVLALGLGALATGCTLISLTSSQAVFVLSYSGLAAIGFGIVATHVVSTGVARLFRANRGLAIGVATSGGQCQRNLRLSAWPRLRNVPDMSSNPFRYFKTSPEIIRLAVMLYIRFPLSLRNVEDLLHERGIDVSHETVRYWWNRFGPIFAAEIRRKRARHLRGWSQWRWHLDEVFVRINGKTHYLWRAVDHEGEVLEAYVSKRRNRKAALKFLRKAMRRYGRPETIVTDKLGSYRAALRTIGNAARQETGRWLNNRAENSHQPLRRRERAMQRFRQMRTLQKFAAIHSSVHNHFNQERHLYSRENFKLNRTAALAEWRQLSAA